MSASISSRPAPVLALAPASPYRDTKARSSSDSPTRYSASSTGSTPSLIPSKPYAPTSTSGSDRRLRPLSMSTSINIPAMLPEETEAGPPRMPIGAIKTGSAAVGSTSTTKLKRLSLLSEPLALRSPGSILLPHPISAPLSRSSTEEETENAEAGPSTPRKPTRIGPQDPTPGQAQRTVIARRELRDPAVRSSISYTAGGNPLAMPASPAATGVRSGLGSGSMETGRRDSVRENSEREDRAQEGRRGSLAQAKIGGRGSLAQRERGVTLTERHADLLTLIAQKERRVSELKHELAQQEAYLNHLKARWTTIVSRSTQPHTKQSTTSSSTSTSSSSVASMGADRNRENTSNPPRPSLRSTTSRARTLITGEDSLVGASSSTINLSSLATSPSLLDPDPTIDQRGIGLEDDSNYAAAQAVLNNLLATAYGPEGVVTPSAVQGGKRFWGQLVKTVSAAAAGSVPDPAIPAPSNLPDGREGEAGKAPKDAAAALDIIASKGLVSLPTWASLGDAISLSSVTEPKTAARSGSNSLPVVQPPAKPIRQPSNLSRLPKSSNVAMKNPSDRGRHHQGDRDTRSIGSKTDPQPSPSLTATSGDLIDFGSSPDDLGTVGLGLVAASAGTKPPSQVMPKETATETKANTDDVDEDEDGWGW